MMRLKQLPHILHFYRLYAPTAIIISMVSCFVLWYNKASIMPVLIIFKIITDLLLRYFMNELGAKKMYYYFNLNIARNTLWRVSLSFDFIIFLAALWITQLAK
jgi:hypothetical protein